MPIPKLNNPSSNPHLSLSLSYPEEESGVGIETPFAFSLPKAPGSPLSSPFSQAKGGRLCLLCLMGRVLGRRMATKPSRGAGVWWVVLCHSLLAAALVRSKNHGNPANDLVDMINKNRTALKLPALNDSPGIGCMALQYIELCKGNCTSNIPHCKVPEDDFTEIFAPNCGVELPTLGTLTGQIVGCHSKYLEPSLAFSQVLVKDNMSLSLLRNKSHTEVGVGLVRAHKGPFFWCVLFSSDRANSTFVLEDQGIGIKQKKGCFSGSSNPCSSGPKSTAMLTNTLTTMLCCLCILLFHM